MKPEIVTEIRTARYTPSQAETLDYLSSSLGISKGRVLQQLFPTREQAESILAAVRRGTPKDPYRAIREVVHQALDRGLKPLSSPSFQTVTFMAIQGPEYSQITHP